MIRGGPVKHLDPSMLFGMSAEQATVLINYSERGKSVAGDYRVSWG